MKQKVNNNTKFMSLNIQIFILLLFLILSFPVNAKHIVLTAFDYPPYMDESLPNKGLFCELVYEAYKSVGYEISFKFVPLKRSTLGVIRGEEIAQLGTRWNFPEEARKNDVQFVPLFYYRVVGFHLNDRIKDISFKTLHDLKGYRLGVIAGSSDAAIFNKYPELNLHIEEVHKIEQLFQKVYQDRSDIIFTVELSGLTFINKDYPDDKERWVMTEDAVQGIVADVIFSKKHPDAKNNMEIFQRGVKRILKNGKYHQVFEKYYGKGKVPKGVSDIYREVYEIPKE